MSAMDRIQGEAAEMREEQLREAVRVACQQRDRSDEKCRELRIARATAWIVCALFSVAFTGLCLSRAENLKAAEDARENAAAVAVSCQKQRSNLQRSLTACASRQALDAVESSSAINLCLAGWNECGIDALKLQKGMKEALKTADEALKAAKEAMKLAH